MNYDTIIIETHLLAHVLRSCALCYSSSHFDLFHRIRSNCRDMSNLVDCRVLNHISVICSLESSVFDLSLRLSLSMSRFLLSRAPTNLFLIPYSFRVSSFQDIIQLSSSLFLACHFGFNSPLCSHVPVSLFWLKSS
jgi:hypothetical protein